MGDKQMIEKREWKEFQNAGLLWWVNRMLHLFGWAIVVEQEEDGTITKAYPARCRFRGFEEDSDGEGFERLTNHIKEQLPNMLEDIE